MTNHIPAEAIEALALEILADQNLLQGEAHGNTLRAARFKAAALLHVVRPWLADEKIDASSEPSLTAGRLAYAHVGRTVRSLRGTEGRLELIRHSHHGTVLTLQSSHPYPIDVHFQAYDPVAVDATESDAL